MTATHGSLEGAAPSAADAQGVRLARGTDAAWEVLVAQHQQRVTRLVHRLLGWSDEAADVVQDVFVCACAELHRFRGESRIETWLYRIAVRACRRHTNRWWRRRVHTGLPDLERAPPTPDVEDQERSTQVRAALQRLPTASREALVLHYIEELPIEAVAVILGISRGAVDVRLNRGRNQLQALLGDKEV